MTLKSLKEQFFKEKSNQTKRLAEGSKIAAHAWGLMMSVTNDEINKIESGFDVTDHD
jgi:hypothetical protein